MDKKEYFKNRFKRDFLQYCLLQEDSLSAEEIAEKLYDAIALTLLIVQGKQLIESLCNEHLSLETLKVGGKLSNDLSEDMGYNLKDKILAEYKEYLDSHSTEEITDAAISGIERSVELQTWSNGIVNMREAIELLVERLENSSRSYGRLYTAPVTENEIREKFNKATENTLLERIQRNNIIDIIEYRFTLREYVRVSCENLLYAKIKEAYDSIANYTALERLKSCFGNLAVYARELKSSIVNCEANEEWDKEYNRLVPAAFYYRNVENITVGHAFQMILFQFFARNEEWMVENGLLENGELKVFRNDIATINRLFCLLSESFDIDK